MYDLVIVGAGIAGLRVGIECSKKGMNCCILERYSVGGRISTFKKHFTGIGDVQWEVGAGRISTSHKKVLQLIKKYGLTFVPHSSDSYYDGDKNNFNELIGVYLEPLRLLDPSVLATHTLGELLSSVLGDVSFISKFPYYSEIHVLRADLALYTFQHEMGSTSFGGCKEGLQAITDSMRDEFVSLGGSIFTGVTVTGITNKIHKNTVFCKTDNVYNEFDAKKIVLAVPSTALKSIKGIRAPVLKHLKMEPLLRIYAVFKKPHTIQRIVTDSPIRYIIPVGPYAVMISYTDGEDARYWRKKDEDAVMKELRKIVDVPDPIFFKKEYWADGCTYWLPGKYNVEEESEKSLQIGENVFLCGESYAVHQCWMESALEQADKLLARF